MFDRLRNTAAVVTNPARLGVLFEKIRSRALREEPMSERDALLAWCAARARRYSDWAEGQDADLWKEATTFAADFEVQARQRLAHTQVQFGGGGAFALLYFLVRKHEPEHVLETGVAAGWSSAAILSALNRNGQGHLWSSDFPYFRQAGADDAIGILVDEPLRARWTLRTDGDRTNLPALLADMPRVDMLHYDSDKTAKGRRFALDQIAAKRHADTIVMFDDIQDNWQYRDDFHDTGVIFEERGKYVGALGLRAD